MKLIDWSTVPQLTRIIINVGAFNIMQAQYLGRSSDATTVFTLATKNPAFSPFLYQKPDSCRIDFSKPQPWLVYEDGITVVPEWAECEYRGIAVVSADDVCMLVRDYAQELELVAHYRITCIKEGWTDETSKVTK